MRSLTCIILLCSLFTFRVSGQKQITDQQLSSDIDKFMSVRFKPDGIGVAVLVARKGNVIFKKAYGMADLESRTPATTTSVFRIASLTKQYTAVAILQLVEKGRLSLNDDIHKHLPDYPPTAHPITIENLLTHTSGIRNVTDMKFPEIMRWKNSTPAEIIDVFKNEPLKFEPGTEFRYSNSGYILLGHMLEKITGKSYEAYVKENIFKPLGMQHAYYDHAEQVVPNRARGYSEQTGAITNAPFFNMTFPYAAGGLMMTVEDMFAWHVGLRRYTILKKETLDKAFVPYTLKNGNKVTYGYGWGLGEVAGSKGQMHSGGVDGFTSFQIYLPTEDVYVVMFCNSGSRNPSTPSMIIACMAAGKDNVRTIDLPIETFNKYAGKYKFPNDPNGIVTIYLEKGKMMFRDSRAPGPWEMHFTSTTDFYCEEVFPNNHSFTTNSEKKVDGFLILDGDMKLKIDRMQE